MPRNRGPRKRKPIDPQLLKSAIMAVANGMNISQASKDYGIPRMTLSDHVKRDEIINGEVIINIRKYGEHSKIFTDEQEMKLAERVIYLSKRGFPINVKQLLQKTYEYACELQKSCTASIRIPQSWIKNEMAGDDWYTGFKSRHPKICLRKPEGLSSNRAQAFNEQRISEYFKTLGDTIADTDPRLIFNVDETGLSSVPNAPGKVLAEKGTRSVNCIEVGERGVLTTVVPCISAAGQLMKPFIIFKGKRKDETLRNELDKYDIHVEMSESGYIDKGIFLNFLKFFQANRPLPDERCILILDGHGSHSGIDVLVYASEHKIELICIPPHTSHRLQPLDTNWNGPFKRLWEQLVREHLRMANVVRINRFEFLRLLNDAWEKMTIKRELIVKGFQHCGIYPLKNVVLESEFEVNKSFQMESAESPSMTACNFTAPLTRTNKLTLQSSPVKSVFPSPKKTLSITHKRPHTTQLTSPDNIAIKKKRVVDGKKTTSKTSRKENPIDPVVRGVRQPSWMNASPSTSRASGVSTDASCSISNKRSSCNSCGQLWITNTMLDFYKCVMCQKWCCEDCFEVERCVDCL